MEDFPLFFCLLPFPSSSPHLCSAGCVNDKTQTIILVLTAVGIVVGTSHLLFSFILPPSPPSPPFPPFSFPSSSSLHSDCCCHWPHHALQPLKEKTEEKGTDKERTVVLTSLPLLPFPLRLTPLHSFLLSSVLSVVLSTLVFAPSLSLLLSHPFLVGWMTPATTKQKMRVKERKEERTKHANSCTGSSHTSTATTQCVASLPSLEEATTATTAVTATVTTTIITVQ